MEERSFDHETRDRVNRLGAFTVREHRKAKRYARILIAALAIQALAIVALAGAALGAW